MSAVDQVVAYVKSGIRSGEYKPGDRLPSEPELAKAVGVGRSTLREGMRILEAYGLVEIRQGDGTYIDNKSEEKFFDILALQSTRNYANLMELRRVIETGSIALVCPKISDEEIARLEELADLLVPEVEIEKRVDADRTFHTRIIEATGNPLIVSLNNMIYQNRMDLLLAILTNTDILHDAYTMHHAIVAALKTRNVTKCVAMVTRHLDITVEHLNKLSLL